MKRLLCMYLIGLSLCSQAQIRDTLIIEQSYIKIELDGQGYHHIYYGDEYTMDEGAPELPIVTRHYYIPHDATNVQLVATVLNEQKIEGTYNVFPSQGLDPISLEKYLFIELDEEWNGLIYPSTFAEIVSDSRIFGYRIVTVCYHPFVYDIENGILTTRNVAISLDYTIGTAEVFKASQSAYRKNKCLEYIKNIVGNPELLNNNEIIATASTYSREVPIRLFAEGRAVPDFIIITNEDLRPAFKQLAEWKTRRGIFTVIETTEYIDSVCSGIDLCEKIRNYIIEKEEHWGEGLAILLGGGIDIIPARTFIGYEGEEVTDFYYVDRISQWPNSNNSFTSFDVCSTIGRFPVNNIQEAEILITKNLNYETGKNVFIDNDYINNSLIASGYLSMNNARLSNGFMSKFYNYVNYYPNKKHWYLFDCFNQSGPVVLNGKEYILEYAKAGIDGQGEELTRENFLKALSVGQDSIGKFHFVYHVDHSGPYSMGASLKVKNQNITSEDIKALDYDNGHYQVILSTGCHPADFNTTCIGKEFLMKPQGGAVAFMGNTDVGWNIEHYFLDEFYKTMYQNSWDWESHLGNYWMNILYRINSNHKKSRFHILGDPTLAFWTETPKHYRNTYSLDNFFLTVTRPDSLQGKGSTICVYKEDEVYLIDTLCARKDMTFYLHDIKTPGYVYITTTGLGQYPQQDSVYMSIVPAENLLEIESVELIDTIDGNSDDCIMPGETIELNVTFRSLSNEAPKDIRLCVSPVEDSMYVRNLTSTYSVLQVLPPKGETFQCLFRFQMKQNLPDLTEHNKNGVQFNIAYETPAYNHLQTYSVDVVNPKLEVYQVNANQIDDNEFTVDISVIVRGNIPFIGGKAILRAGSNSHIALIDSICDFDASIGINEIRQFNFKCESSIQPAETTTFSLAICDELGNTYIMPINPFAKEPSIVKLTLQPEGNYIDVSGDIFELYCMTTGETLVTQGANFYRHTPLEPLSTYTYKYKRKIDGKVSNLSPAYSVMTQAERLNGFPEIVEHSSAFRGLVNCWDVNCDGKQEIFAATWDYLDPDGSLVAVTNSGSDLYRDSDPYMLESFAQTQGNFMNGVAIGELYDDGEQYIVSATYNDYQNTINSVYCHKTTDNDGDGYPDLHWKLDSTLINSPRSPIIADLDGDDINEIIVPSIGNVTIFESDGRIRKTIYCSISYKHLAIANVIPNSVGKQLLIPADNSLSVYDSKGECISQYRVAFSDKVSTPIVCDYDNDGYMEAIVGELLKKEKDELVDTIAIYAIKYREGQVDKTKLFVYPRPLVGRMDAPFVVGDLDKDNHLEIVAICNSAYKSGNSTYYRDSIIVYNDVAVKKRQAFYCNTSESLHHLPVLADVDGDANIDIVFQYDSSKGRIQALSYTNGTTQTLTQNLYSTTNDGLTLSDVDSDGYLDMVYATLAGRIYVFKTRGLTENLEWGCSRANPQNTGEYGKITYPIILKTGTYSEEILEQDLYVTGNSVTIKDNTLTFAPHRKIVVWEDGVLNIDGATLNNARIVIKSGGKLNITNGGIINSRDNKSFVISKGGRLKISNGYIK